MESTEARTEARSILRHTLQDLLYQFTAMNVDYELARAFGKDEEDDLRIAREQLLQAIAGVARILREVS